MLVLITYDINTSSSAGRKRLKTMADICTDYGQRVQNSVYECILDNAQLILVRSKLLSIMNPKEDSLRIYNLGNNYQKRMEQYGCKESYDAEGDLFA